MEEKDVGILIRSRAFTETSLLLQWLTEKNGRLATIAKGARRPKSAFRGRVDLFHLCDLRLARARRSSLHTLLEVRVVESHALLRTDYLRLSQASYSVALLEACTESDTPLPDLFVLVRDFLAHLASPTPASFSVFAFELRLLEALGFKPDLRRSGLNNGAQRLLHDLRAVDWSLLSRLRLSPAQAEDINRYLMSQLRHQMDHLPKQRVAALQELLPRPPANPRTARDETAP